MMSFRPALAAPPSVVPLDVVASASPVPVMGEDGLHLLYELRLTNFSPREVVLESIDVMAGDRLLGHHDALAVAGMIGTPGQAKAGDARLRIGAGGFALVFFDMRLPGNAPPPASLVHRVHVGNADPAAPASRTEFATPALAVSARAPILLGAPLHGGGWVAANALSNSNDHRRTVVVADGQARLAQRYAIDFVKLDAAGRAFVGDPGGNAAWAGYDSEVLAVADGLIEEVGAGIPDNIPGSAPSVPITLDTIGGNHVVLALPGGARVFYGHLKPGSIKVQAGQRISKGQVIGRVGNSGQSDAPHLHLHVADGASALGAEGLAYAFEGFAIEGYVPSLDILENEAGWQHSAAAPNVRRDELPIENAVISFGKGRAG